MSIGLKETKIAFKEQQFSFGEKAMAELLIVLADDWELRGNGKGSVEKLQYVPAVRLMDLYESLGIFATFNVEVMQQMAFMRESEKYASFDQDIEFWEKGVKEISRRGFDVQLHIHPQWKYARYDGEKWLLDARWNLGVYPKNEIRGMVKAGCAFLKERTGKNPLAFRAGGWAAYPSRCLLAALEEQGIVIDISVVNGYYNNGDCLYVDYLNLESPYSPYYPDSADVRKVSAKKEKILEIPTQAVLYEELGENWPRGEKCKRFAPLWAKLRRWKLSYPAPQCVDLSKLDPFGYLRRIAQQDIILDFSAKIDPEMFKRAMRLAMQRALDSGTNVLVFENHTKDLQIGDDFERVRSYVEVIKNFGHPVKFVTLDYLANNLDLIAISGSYAE